MFSAATASLRAPMRRSMTVNRALSLRSLHSSMPRLMATEPPAAPSDYSNIIVESAGNGVTLIKLNRPKALNALNSELFTELNHATAAADEDPSVGAIVITGSEKAFAGE